MKLCFVKTLFHFMYSVDPSRLERENMKAMLKTLQMLPVD